MGYSVTRSPEVSGAADALVALWSRNLKMRGQPRDKFDWYYAGNPLSEADAFLLKHQRDEAAETEIVGCCGAGVRLVRVDGREMRSGLFADFAVDKDHRTVMPALMLQRALCGHVTSTFDFGYGFPNGAAVGIFGRIGFPLLGQMGRFVKVLRYGHFLQRKLPRPLAAIAGRALDLASAGKDLVTTAATRTRFAWVPDVDERFDGLWQSVAARYPIIGERSARFLRWRFVTRPGVRSHIGALTDDSGQLRAYAAVVDKDPGVALVADFLALTDDDLRALLRRLSGALRRRGYHSAVTLFLGAPAIAGILKDADFQFRNLAKFVVVGGGRGVDEARLRKTDDWYLTEADRDN